MCRGKLGPSASASWGPGGSEKRGSSGVGERDRLAGVYGVASVLGDQVGVLQPP